MTRARSRRATGTCDYVVVGSGAGGGTRRGAAGRGRRAGPAARSRRRSARANGGDRAAMGDANRLPDDYDVPAFHPFATENEALRWDFFVRHYADRRSAARPDYRSTGTDGGRRRPLSARRDARRLHRAQCDDPDRAARFRLGRHRRADRRRVLARRQHARATSAGSSTAATARAGTLPRRFGIDRTRPRLGRLAADREGAAA